MSGKSKNLFVLMIWRYYIGSDEPDIHGLIDWLGFLPVKISRMHIPTPLWWGYQTNEDCIY